MCGIAGFSLNKNSRVNARALSHYLLTEIEVRGRMASGVAFKGADGSLSVYKDAVAGSNLPLRSMPRDTKTAIMHTRYATQGSPAVNENNHPVWSPFQTIALVHNGVIWNDWQIRRSELLDLELPQVDSSVIPALLELKGLPGIKHLAGDAAISWMNTEDLDVLHVARIESSPVAYTNLEDGSFVFASTPQILRRALTAATLEHGEVFVMGELDYYKVRGGVIWSYNEVPEPEGFGMGYARSTRNATSGGHGTTTTSTYTTASEPKVLGTGETLKTQEEINAEIDAEVDAWMAREEKAVTTYNEVVNINGKDRDVPMFRVGFDRTAEVVDIDEGEEDFIDPRTARFYTIDHDGGMEVYDTLDELETRLLYLAGKTGDEGLGENKEKWVNHFSDVGSLDLTGDESNLISWVEEPSEIRVYDDPNGDGLGYIRDGVSILSSLAGR